MDSIFRIKGTFSFLAVIFLNAFVDLGHKITIQNTVFKVYDGSEQVIITAILNALILLPFIMLFTPSGFLSDKFPKTFVMKISAVIAVAISCLITLCYFMGWFHFAFVMTFLLATQSAFYGPAKTAYIKTLYGEKHLTEGNGITQATVMIAILFGTVAFSALFEILYIEELHTAGGILKKMWWLGILLITFSILEWLLVLRLPEKDGVNQALSFDKTAYLSGKTLRANIGYIFDKRIIIWPILGLCMFWSVGQVMLATFPAFVKEQVGLTNTLVLQLTLGATGIGIVIGAYIAGKLSHAHINTRFVPFAAAGIVIGLVFLPFLKSVIAMAIVFAGVGLCGGLFVVPLNALIQKHADQHKLGSVLAGKNFFQNIVMLLFLALTAFFAYYGLSSQTLLILLAVFALFASYIVVTNLKKSLSN